MVDDDVCVCVAALPLPGPTSLGLVEFRRYKRFEPEKRFMPGCC